MDVGQEQGPSKAVPLLPIPMCMFTWGLILTVFKQVEEAAVPLFMAGTALAEEGMVMQIRIVCLWV